MLKKKWTNPNEPREGSRRSPRKRNGVFKEPAVSMLEKKWTNPNEPSEGSRRSTRKRNGVFKEPPVIQHGLLEKKWTNPNEPKEGCRRSTRKRNGVFKEPPVIQHRLLLGPTLARRKARKRRREQENNEAAGSRSKKQSTNDQSSSYVTLKDELRRKLGPHGQNMAIISDSSKPAATDASTGKVLTQQPPPSTATDMADKTRSTLGTSLSTSPKSQVEGSPNQTKSKEPKKRSKKTNELRPSGVADNPIDLTTEEPTLPPIPATTISPTLARRGLPPIGLLLPNPSAVALVSPVALPTYGDFGGITSSLTRRSHQVVALEEDSSTLQMLKKREHAIRLMQRATDVSSIVASSRLVREFYVGSLLDPSTRVLLEEAEGRGMLWLSKLLVGTFSRPIILGGLGFSLTKAKLIADEIVVNYADMIGKIDLSSDTLVGLRILPHDAVMIAPVLRVFGAAIREKSLVFRQEIILKAETRSFGLPMIPTAASYSPLSLGVSAAYGF